MDYHPDYNLDLASTIKAAMVNMCGEPHIAAHLPLAPAVTPMEPQNRPPPAEPLSSYKSFATLETVPYSFDQTGPTAFAEGSVEPPVPYTYQETGFSENGMWPMHPHSKLGMYNQGQLRGQYNNWIPPPQQESQNFHPNVYQNTDEVYDYPTNVYTPPDIASPLGLDLTLQKKRRHISQPDCNREYVKRPPNAFMVFRKEQRPHVVAETKISDCAAVNKILGQRWKMLTKKEQAKYYEEAKKERAMHAQLYPYWSAKDNYGNMPKRVRRRTAKGDAC